MTGYFELFDWHFAVPGEEQNIPIVKPHCNRREGRKHTTGRSRKNIEKKPNWCKDDASSKGLGESNYTGVLFQGWLRQERIKLVNNIMLKIGGYQVAGQRYRPIIKPAGFDSTSSEQLQNWQQHVRSPGLIDRNPRLSLKSAILRRFLWCPNCRESRRKMPRRMRE